MQKKIKIVIIGINHAGTTAIKTIMKNNPNNEVIAYDRNDNISFLGCGIALWIGKEFSNPKGLFYATIEKLKSLGVKIKKNHEMINLDNKNKKITIKNLENNEIFIDSYDKLILAIGSWPILNPGNKQIPGLISNKKNQIIKNQFNKYKLTDGIYLSKLFQHAQDIINNLNKPEIKKVVIIGAGYIGVELVEAFYKEKKEVTLIDFENRIMSRYYDKEFTNDIENEMKKNGINLRLGETLIEFIIKNNKVYQVKTNKNIYYADLVIMSIGFTPNTNVLKDKNNKSPIELDNQGAIKVNKYFQTSDPDIFAIGDCINIFNNALNQNINIALATNAIRSGLIAGLNISKKNNQKLIAFPGVQGTNAICVFNWKLCSTGLSELSAKKFLGENNIESYFYQDTVRPPFMNKNHDIKIKIIWEKKSRFIIGTEISSIYDHTETILMFSLAILKKVTIDEIPLIDIYFLPHFNKPYNFVTAASILATGILSKEDVIYPNPYIKNEKK